MTRISYKRNRFPPAVISNALGLYSRLTLSLRDVGEMMAQRFRPTHPAICNACDLQHHVISWPTFQLFRVRADSVWMKAVA